MSNLSELNESVEIKLGFRVENYATPLENNMLLPLPIDEFGEYAEAFANEQRVYSLDFGYPTQIEKTVRIRIPEGWKASVPEDIHYAIESAEFTRQYRQIDNILTYQLIFTLKNRILPATAYTEAKPFFTALASEDGSHVLLNTSGYGRMSRK
jgi:transglutaminase-like putative cysteine protease